MDFTQLKYLIEFVLIRMDKHLDIAKTKFNRPEAIDLLLGTACVESNCGHYLFQKDSDNNNWDDGLGIFQMEIATHNDIWKNYIDHRPELRQFLINEIPAATQLAKFENLAYSLRYAIIMTRLYYFRITYPIPKNLDEQARYWKAFYNTTKGKGTMRDYIKKWEKYHK